MKKSFKKAGAAVLSMAMLLAMGAVSLPVYAATPAEYVPGQIEVKVGTKFADDGTESATTHHTYDYIPEISSATVSLYKIATLTDGGWDWDAAVKSYIQTNASQLQFSTPLDAADNGPIDLTKFEDLLRQVKDAGTNKDIPAATSEQMLALASMLERAVRATQATGYTGTVASAIASDTITSEYDILNLPTDDDLYDNDGTKNVVGYYLILTDTNDSGVFVQPALVVLKNDKDGKNVKQVSLKGSALKIDKSIEKVDDKTDKVDLAGTSTAAGNSVSTSKDTAVVGSNDKIRYQIKVPLPKYDVNTSAATINDFVIVDTPEDGINLLDVSNGTGTMKTGLETTDTYKVEWCATENGTYASMDNSEYTFNTLPYGARVSDGVNDANGQPKVAYEVLTGAGTGTDITGKGGFMLTMNGTQLKAKDGGYVKITFYGEVDSSKLDRGYTDVKDEFTAATLTDIELALAENSDDSTNLNALGINRTPTDEAGWKALFMTSAEGATLREKVGITDGMTEEQVKSKVDTYIGTFTTVTALSGTPTQAEKYERAAKLAAAMVIANDNIKKQNDEIKAGNGTTNTAGVTYGNDFATGGGKGSDEDVTTLFNVALNLDKIVEENLIKDKDDPTADTEDKADTIDVTKETKLANAVFKLEKNYYDGSAAATSTPTYAVTTLDKTTPANPVTKLVALTELTYTAPVAPATEGTWSSAPSGATVYEWTEETSEGKVAHKAYYDPNNAVQAWDALKLGEYTLTEVKAPAGYKKWENPVKFTVTATQDSTGDFTGEFGATDGTNYSGVAKDLRTAAEQAVTDPEAAGYVAPYYFSFDAEKGDLDTTVKDEIEDRLPATGGIGTVLFTAGGISIVLIAGALFVMYMKKRNSEEEE